MSGTQSKGEIKINNLTFPIISNGLHSIIMLNYVSDLN